MNYDYRGIGLTISNARKAKNLTQAEFADKLGVSAQAISKWETGAGYPDLSMLPSIASTLGLSMDELFGAEQSREVKDEKNQRPKEAPQKYQSMSWIATYGDKLLYAETPARSIKLPEVILQDGSTIDLASNMIVNQGQRISIFRRSEFTPGNLHYAAYESEAEAQTNSNSYQDADFDSIIIDSQFRPLKIKITANPNEPTGWRIHGDAQAADTLEFEKDGKTLIFKFSNFPKRRGIFETVFSASSYKKSTLWINCPENKMKNLKLDTNGTASLQSAIDFAAAEAVINGACTCDLLHVDNFKLNCKGAGIVRIGSAHNIELESSGAGKVAVDQLTGGRIDYRGYGAAVMKCSGEAKEVTIDLAGASVFEGNNLCIDDLSVVLSGPCSCTIGRVRGKSRERINFGKLVIHERGEERA
ncbi:MAG: helix-turn-helix domain-containing protein [Eubacteriales bacterium]|nr:helix-turn-helix domain-containing protein [Eubacteriales bacterium]